MCCCCPPAISALFCLWFQSGCSKGTVAGALTFFPPEPALYQFERHGKDGRVIQADQEADGTANKQQLDEDNNNNNNNDSNNSSATLDADGKDQEGAKSNSKRKKPNQGRSSNADSNGSDNEATVPTVQQNDSSKTDDEDDDEDRLGLIEGPGRTGPIEAETKGQTNDKMKSPIQQLTEQATERRRRAKQRATRDSNDAVAGVTYRLLLDPRLSVPPHDTAAVEAVKIPGKRSDVYIAAVLCRASRPNERTKTIIYSHGNATDIGAMFPLQVVMASSLNCNVVMYDYSGYGESGGVPDENNTYQDIEQVYSFVWEHVAGRHGHSIVLYGQSVGSGPCCYLAAKPADVTAVGGMILHSPFTSGMRVLTPSRALACLDIYPNIDRIKKTQCPVLIIHGKLDQEVDVSHGQELYRAVPEPMRREPWWVSNRGHNDITDGQAKLTEYIRRIRSFLESLPVS